MTALAPGKLAPEFSLPAMDGKTFSMPEALSQAPVVLAFFKISCPVCQFALPVLERIFRAPGGRNVSIVGVSQNEKKHTAAFTKEFGLTFPVLLEDTDRFPVSNAFGLTHVPTLFWISPDRRIEISSVGWSRQDMDEINRRAAETMGQNPQPLFRPGENIPEYRPG
jgi:peroxiredoxin